MAPPSAALIGQTRIVYASGASIEEGYPMINARALAAIVAAAVLWQAQIAQAEEYRIVGADAATACKSRVRSRKR
jgi:hypothetical protein